MLYSNNNMTKVAVVTGSSSGIGYATSLMLARNGFYTYASVRDINKSATLQSVANTEKLPLKPIQLEVTDDSSVKNALEKIVSEKGRIDVLVNNAGYGVIVPFSDHWIPEEQPDFVIKLLNNFFGSNSNTKTSK
jgi:NAD(P)-dependent dehydrogenase (short-subunit alcohol dehydrogenase family)